MDVPHMSPMSSAQVSATITPVDVRTLIVPQKSATPVSRPRRHSSPCPAPTGTRLLSTLLRVLDLPVLSGMFHGFSLLTPQCSFPDLVPTCLTSCPPCPFLPCLIPVVEEGPQLPMPR